MKQNVLTALALAACLTTSEARIGETAAQIEARYGEPHDPFIPSPERKVYKFNGFTINVLFREGRSVQEVIWKAEEMSMAPEVVKGLLKANAAPGTTWQPYGRSAYRRSDGRAMADLVSGTLTIYAMEKGELKRAERLVEKSETAKTKGF